MSDFNSFFNAIAGQESGGNYRAVNARTGALGKYQIMPGNIPGWSKQYLGRTITASQFLNSPALQEQLARAVLSSYYKNYGARGAAAAWYSGDYRKANNYNKFNANEPSIGEYVDQVLARQGGSGSYGYVSPTAVKDDRVKQTDLSQVYDQGQQPTQIDALKGTDVKGLGLGQLDTTTLAANTGGVGAEAPTMTSPVDQTSTAKPTAGDVAMQSSGLLTEAKANGDTGRRNAVIDIAKQYLGTPYRWGGTQPGGFDCSGLIQYAMKTAGISIARTSWDQIAMGKRVGLGALKPGDLVGFGDGHHIAIWLGNGQILEAPHTGANVRIRTLGKGESAFGVDIDSLYR